MSGIARSPMNSKGCEMPLDANDVGTMEVVGAVTSGEELGLADVVLVGTVVRNVEVVEVVGITVIAEVVDVVAKKSPKSSHNCMSVDAAVTALTYLRIYIAYEELTGIQRTRFTCFGPRRALRCGTVKPVRNPCHTASAVSRVTIYVSERFQAITDFALQAKTILELSTYQRHAAWDATGNTVKSGELSTHDSMMNAIVVHPVAKVCDLIALEGAAEDNSVGGDSAGVDGAGGTGAVGPGPAGVDGDGDGAGGPGAVGPGPAGVDGAGAGAVGAAALQTAPSAEHAK
jgi:hypothetical protein